MMKRNEPKPVLQVILEPLVVLLAFPVLMCLAVIVSCYGEQIDNYITNLLRIWF